MIKRLNRDHEEAIQTGATNLGKIESRMNKMKQEINEIFGEDQNNKDESESKTEEYGMKAFTRDLRTKFLGMDDIYVACIVWCLGWSEA